MAFLDTLITESGARVVMIDRACQPWWTLDHRLPVRAAAPAIPAIAASIQRAQAATSASSRLERGLNELSRREYAPTSMLYCSSTSTLLPTGLI